MRQELVQRHFHAAVGDLDPVLDHPNLIDYLRSDSENLTFLINTASQLARHHLAGDALRIADRLISCSPELGPYRGRFYYTKAAVLSVGARSDPEQIPQVAKHLKFAFIAHARFKEWYRQDELFDPIRAQLDAVIDQLPDLPSRF